MSTSASPGRSFYRALIILVAGLGLGILILGLLVTTSGPWVRQVVVHNRSGGEVSSVDQGLTVVFDRPVENADFANAIDIQPEIDYTVSHHNQQLNITFNQNLLSNAEYVLTVHPGLKDDLGKQMESAYTYKFTTAEPSFTYLERNHDSGAVDRVIQRAPLSGESHALFGARGIKSFARNGSYLAVVLTRADGTDDLRVLDLGTHEEKPVDIPSDVRIDNLQFSPVDNQFVFITRAIAREDTSESYLKTYGNRLYRYNVDGEQLQPIETLSSEGNVESVLYSHDGQALLYRTLDGEYYLTGAAQETEPTLLSKYEDSGGFDRTNTKLVFLYRSGAAIYDAQAGNLQELPDIRVGGRISMPVFLHDSDGLIYLRDPLDAQSDEHLEVCTVSADGEVEKQVVDSEPPARFFGDPAVSDDDRYVLIETTPRSQSTGGYNGEQPVDTRLLLYDRFDRKVIDSGIRGTNPVWSR